MEFNQKKAFIIVVICQLLIFGFMIGKRLHLLNSEKTVLFSCRPVDPRSLFSGDYVILQFNGISTISQSLNIDEGKKAFKKNETVYVAVEKKEGEKFYEACAVSRDIKKLKETYQYVLRGKAKNYRRVKYGVEEYFVPQYEGLKIERNLRNTTVEIAIAESGESAIKRLFINGEEVRFY